MRVFITGGTGLIGGRLIRRLRDRGDEVVVLSRRLAAAQSKFPDCTIVEGDPGQPGPWQARIADCDAVIHLAGENIFARRWNEAFQKILYDSRIKSTEHVVQALKEKPLTADGRPKILVNASAIGIYGDRGDEQLTEESAPGNDFLAKICVDWEKAASQARESGVRTTSVRIGIVLDMEGGAFREMIKPFKMFVGGKVGNGKQYYSWIHHVDMLGILMLALDNPQASGPINGTAPNPIRNGDFAGAIGKAMHRPSFFPTPAFALRLALGGASTLVTSSQFVVPRRALDLGYQFKFSTVEAALADLFAPKANG